MSHMHLQIKQKQLQALRELVEQNTKELAGARKRAMKQALLDAARR